MQTAGAVVALTRAKMSDVSPSRHVRATSGLGGPRRPRGIGEASGLTAGVWPSVNGGKVEPCNGSHVLRVLFFLVWGS